MKVISKSRLSSAPWSWLPCLSAPLQRHCWDPQPRAGQSLLGQGVGDTCLWWLGWCHWCLPYNRERCVGVQNRLAARGGFCYPGGSGIPLAVLPCWDPHLGRESSAGLHTSFAEDFYDRCNISSQLCQVTAAPDPSCRQGKSLCLSPQGCDIQT